MRKELLPVGLSIAALVTAGCSGDFLESKNPSSEGAPTEEVTPEPTGVVREVQISKDRKAASIWLYDYDNSVPLGELAVFCVGKAVVASSQGGEKTSVVGVDDNICEEGIIEDSELSAPR